MIYMITVKDIANLAGVSPATVSNVLNGKANVGQETKEKVLSICRDVCKKSQDKKSTHTAFYIQ